VEIGDDVIAGDCAFLNGNENISGFGVGAVISIDDYAGAADGECIRLASAGLKGADQVEVRAGAKIAAVEQRGWAGGAGAQNVGLGGESVGIGGKNGATQFGGHFSSEIGGG